MKTLSHFILLIILMTAGIGLNAQDTLPKFSVKNAGANRIIIGWKNNFESVKQISIQRSFDSLKNFKTILTVADPDIPENGFVDTKAPNDRMFYRLYIQLDKGVFLFSDPKRPVPDTAVLEAVRNGRLQKPGSNGNNHLGVIPIDSLINAPTIATDNKPRAERWIPSKRIYTEKDGYIRITLPEEEKDKKYDIKFYTAEDELVFEIKDLAEKSFKIDKTNFYRSGWFKFELFENGELLEKNKFFLPKEF